MTSGTTKRLSQALAFRYIDAVAKCGSIRKAGELLNVSSTSINRKVIEFESSVGSPIFERLAHGVKLTAVGQKLIEYIHRQELSLDQIVSEINDLRNGNTGHIKIATAEVAPRTFLARELAAFHNQRPRVTYEVRITSSDRVVSSVLNDEASVGLAIGPPNNQKLLLLCQMSFFPHALVSSNHPLSQSERLSIDDCAKYPVAVYDSSFEQRPGPAIQQILHDVQGAIRTNSIELLMQMAQESSMICSGVFYPSNKPQRLGPITTIPLALHGDVTANLALLVRRGRPLSAAVSAFTEQLNLRMSSIARARR